VDCVLGHIQFWLQGWPNKKRPRWMVSVGNRLATARFQRWERRNPLTEEQLEPLREEYRKRYGKAT
jgi:hypothetical protein